LLEDGTHFWLVVGVVGLIVPNEGEHPNFPGSVEGLFRKRYISLAEVERILRFTLRCQIGKGRLGWEKPFHDRFRLSQSWIVTIKGLKPKMNAFQ
jgi:hypothetical protein